MPKNNSKIQDLTQQFMNGAKMADILRENPGVSKSTIYHHVRNIKNSNHDKIEQPVSNNIIEHDHIEPDHIEPDHIEPDHIEPVQAPVQRQAPRVDSFLGSHRSKGSKKLSWAKEDKLDSLFGDLFADKPSYDPSQLASVQEKTAEKSFKDKPLSWWKKQPKTKKEQERDEMIETENERMKIVQQIRLYFISFPQLQNLHIIPKDKKTNEPDLEKYLISLYTMKENDLYKILNFVQFHCRNSVSENSSKVFENVAGTIVKFSEHLLVMCGLKVQGLTEQVMADEEILRCIKEIQIESSISTFNYGPKTDLGIQLCSAIARLDTSNRIKERIENQAKKEDEQIIEKPKINNEVIDKYSDL